MLRRRLRDLGRAMLHRRLRALARAMLHRRVRDLARTVVGATLRVALCCSGRKVGVALLYHGIGGPVRPEESSLVPSIPLEDFAAKLSVEVVRTLLGRPRPPPQPLRGPGVH